MNILGFLYPYTFHRGLRKLRSVIHTFWIKNFFGKIGKGTIVNFNCELQGNMTKRITIGNNTRIESHCVIGCWGTFGAQHFNPSMTIGDKCRIGEYSHISTSNEIVIGNGVLTGRFVLITDNSHGGLSWDEAGVPPIERKLVSKGGIYIGDNVWIGDKSTILSGVHIGNNAIVASNSVVNKDVPSNCIVAGSPAKIIKELK